MNDAPDVAVTDQGAMQARNRATSHSTLRSAGKDAQVAYWWILRCPRWS
jgi:hypothetical protein